MVSFSRAVPFKSFNLARTPVADALRTLVYIRTSTWLRLDDPMQRSVLLYASALLLVISFGPVAIS